MKYTLINAKGKIRTFFVKEVAELYQINEGGVIFTAEILEQEIANKECA